MLACPPVCPLHSPVITQEQTERKVAGERVRDLRGWGRGDWSRIKGYPPRDFMFVIPSHLGGRRLRRRRRSRKLPHFDVRPTVFRRGGGNECYGGGRESDRWRIGHRRLRRRRTGCGPDGRWMADGQTQREKNFRFMTCYRWNRYRVLWGWLLQQPEGRTKTMRCHLEPLLLENK